MYLSSSVKAPKKKFQESFFPRSDIRIKRFSSDVKQFFFSSSRKSIFVGEETSEKKEKRKNKKKNTESHPRTSASYTMLAVEISLRVISSFLTASNAQRS